mmetsp:Transcript_18488/g.30760  ORF Transcript_18488/g.30760 Transcript_18488/m.30760 type:complete len:85 (-) Transcript_18488:3046-3300(-)
MLHAFMRSEIAQNTTVTATTTHHWCQGHDRSCTCNYNNSYSCLLPITTTTTSLVQTAAAAAANCGCSSWCCHDKYGYPIITSTL